MALNASKSFSESCFDSSDTKVINSCSNGMTSSDLSFRNGKNFLYDTTSKKPNANLGYLLGLISISFLTICLNIWYFMVRMLRNSSIRLNSLKIDMNNLNHYNCLKLELQ